MENYALGETAIFTQSFADSAGDLVDPPEVTFTIYRTYNNPTIGPLYYDGGDGDVAKVSTGNYRVTVAIHPQLIPGIYTVEWSGVVDGSAVFEREEFQIQEPVNTPLGLLDPPRVSGVMRPSPSFNDMGLGGTAQLFIVGHCSGLTINEPYQIRNIQEALNIIGANQYSPMVRYVLEAYNAGCRDIWIMPAAPESEYMEWDPNSPGDRRVAQEAWGGETFYEKYLTAYTAALEALEGSEYPDIIVAPDAPFYDTGGVDFLTPLIDCVSNGFTNTGRVRLGFIGTLIGNAYTQADVDALVGDSRLDNLTGASRSVGIFHGDALIRTPNMPSAYASSSALSAAAMAASLDFSASLTYKFLPNVVAPLGADLTAAQISALANAKINPLIRRNLGRRGRSFASVLATDNMLAEPSSVFWAFPQIRIIQEIVKTVRAFARSKIGTIEYQSFRSEVSDYMASLIFANKIRDYSLRIDRKQSDMHTVEVEISIKPFYGIRDISFTVEVGAGQVVDNALGNAL